MRPLGLYLHIPFCRSKCIYCDFYSLPHREEEMDLYCRQVRRQLALWGEKAAQHTVDTVYFGGGTPSYLGAERLTALLSAVFEAFRVAPDAEITFEANPDSAQDEAALRALRRAGFNRISLGMQSADDAQLRRLGRIHTHAETVQAVASARAAGFHNISLDLIYGLPYQSAASWLADLRAAIALKPEHLSCYGLRVEERTPLFKLRKALSLPDDDTQADCYLAGVKTLAQAGYEQYEISNFARPGFASRHNSRYWSLGEYLGLGPGAHSDFLGRRFAYARDLEAWQRGEARFSEDAAIGPEERLAERVMLSLRTVQGLDLRSLGRPAGKAEALFEKLRSAGLAVQGPDAWHLTPRGFLVSNSIIVDTLEAFGL